MLSVWKHKLQIWLHYSKGLHTKAGIINNSVVNGTCEK